MALEYLVAASNEMFLALAGEMTPDAHTLSRIAAIGCNTLQDVLADPVFLASVISVSAGRIQYAEQYDDITGRLNESIEHFGYFLNVERKVMLQAGLDTRIVEQLIVEARRLLPRIRDWDGDFEGIVAMTTQVRDQACQLASTLADKQNQSDRRKGIMRQMRRITYAVAGTAVMVLNASVPFPLSAAGATVSGAFGGALISAAVPPVQ